MDNANKIALAMIRNKLGRDKNHFKWSYLGDSFFYREAKEKEQKNDWEGNLIIHVCKPREYMLAALEKSLIGTFGTTGRVVGGYCTVCELPFLFEKNEQTKYGFYEVSYPKSENKNGLVHKQKQIKIKGRLVEVDEGITELVTLLNNAGIETLNSCIGEFSRDGIHGSYLMFKGRKSIKIFQQIWDNYLIPLGYFLPSDAWSETSKTKIEFNEYHNAETASWHWHPKEFSEILPLLVNGIRDFLKKNSEANNDSK